MATLPASAGRHSPGGHLQVRFLKLPESPLGQGRILSMGWGGRHPPDHAIEEMLYGLRLRD